MQLLQPVPPNILWPSIIIIILITALIEKKKDKTDFRQYLLNWLVLHAKDENDMF